MRRSPSPGFIALFSSIISTLVVATLLLLFSENWYVVGVVSAINLVVSFFLFYLLLQYFIQQKIMMIYQNIYRFKAKDKKMLKLLNNPLSDPISDVSEEVLAWMQDNKKEILELKEQQKFRREFIGNVSHELKTPVFNVQGYIHTLLDGALEDTDVNRKFLKKAARGIDRLAETVEELTSISEFQSGKFKLNIEEFDFGELVTEVFEVIDSMARSRQVKLIFTKTGLRSTAVKADYKRIRQVLINLVVNAIKYGKKDGQVEVNCSSMDKQILVKVSDDGAGIETEHLNRLFDRFYRVDSHRNREEGGSGLGLSIAKHIVEAHEQTINVKSERGVGSTFEFTLAKA